MPSRDKALTPSEGSCFIMGQLWGQGHSSRVGRGLACFTYDNTGLDEDHLDPCQKGSGRGTVRLAPGTQEQGSLGRNKIPSVDKQAE